MLTYTRRSCLHDDIFAILQYKILLYTLNGGAKRTLTNLWLLIENIDSLTSRAMNPTIFYVTVRLGDSLQPKLTSTLHSGIQRSVISCVCIRQLTGNICIEAT